MIAGIKILKTIVLVFTILVLSVFILNYFIFNIYEVDVAVNPSMVFADTSTEIKLTVKPITAMGWVVPFRTVNAKFKILEGNNLVTVKLIDEEKGFIILKAKGREGKVSIYIDSEYSLFPIYVNIKILPKTV